MVYFRSFMIIAFQIGVAKIALINLSFGNGPIIIQIKLINPLSATVALI